ncbi:hypothetical protein [Nostoc sp.]|uniref:hypothetical protein n=1 Tax=Nostoc sp. TaxID=1180 RepID=UPI002FF62BF0
MKLHKTKLGEMNLGQNPQVSGATFIENRYDDQNNLDSPRERYLMTQILPKSKMTVAFMEVKR